MSNLYEELMPNEPRIMPMQSVKFNGDDFACMEFIKLKEARIWSNFFLKSNLLFFHSLKFRWV